MPDYDDWGNSNITTTGFNAWTTAGTTASSPIVSVEREQPPPRVPFATLNLWDEFRHWQVNSYLQGRDAFVAYITAKVSDPDNVVINWCARCSMPDKQELTDVQGVEMCSTCVRTYVVRCGNCDEQCMPSANYGGQSWCTRCTNEHLYYCDHCGEYSRRTDDPHMHRNTPCECRPPTYEIRLRRVEKKRIIREDTKIVVDLPRGIISSAAMQEIRVYLQVWADKHRHALGNTTRSHYIYLSGMLGEVGSEWQTNRGNFTKRLTSYAYKTYGLKLDPEVITQIGNIGRAQSNGVSTKVAFTRDLNQPRREFVHHGSCWWSDYNSSRCILKSNGGFAMRTFSGPRGSGATGRAWVLPMDRTAGWWVPTFDTLTPTGFVIFNGYGDLEDYAPARIMSEITGLPYHKIGFDDEEMYVNNESAYLLVPVDVPVPNGISLEMPRHANIYNQREQAHA